MIKETDNFLEEMSRFQSDYDRGKKEKENQENFIKQI